MKLVWIEDGQALEREYWSVRSPMYFHSKEPSLRCRMTLRKIVTSRGYVSRSVIIADNRRARSIPLCQSLSTSGIIVFWAVKQYRLGRWEAPSPVLQTHATLRGGVRLHFWGIRTISVFKTLSFYLNQNTDVCLNRTQSGSRLCWDPDIGSGRALH